MTIKYDNLIGRPFDWGTSDCIALVRDFYKQNFDIDIPNYARPSNWNADNLDLIGMLYEQSGFQMITDWDLKDLRPGDLLACAVGSKVANHLVIYAGDNTLVHHKFQCYSADEPLRPAWKMFTNYLLRHPKVPDLTPEVKKTSIEEILRARYQLQVTEPVED